MAAKLSFIHNGRGSGSVANRLLANDMDIGCLRPFYNRRRKKSYMCLANGTDDNGKPRFRNVLTNAPATLQKEEWMRFDNTVLRVARDELRVWGDIMGAGLSYTVPDGMGVTVIQHQTMTDAGEATLSMSGLRKTKRDRPEFELAGIPLPIVHSDFSFDLRSVRVSQRLGLPLDTTMLEQATRRCVETIEDWTLGIVGSYSYAGYTVYGLTNHPARLTYTMTLPTDAGWEPQVTYDEILDMLQQADDINFNGPWAVYFSRGWTKYLSKDYSSAYPGSTLRSKLREIDEISYVRKAERLSNFQVLLVQLRPETIQAIQGMALTTVQWEEEGGMELMYKVLGIMVPRIRANADGDTGIVHGVAA